MPKNQMAALASAVQHKLHGHSKDAIYGFVILVARLDDPERIEIASNMTPESLTAMLYDVLRDFEQREEQPTQ